VKLIVSVTMLLIAASLAFAENKYAVTGVVVDPTGARVPGAIISFESNGFYVKKHSDKEGAFSARLPKAQYKIRVTKKNFCPTDRANLDVSISIGALRLVIFPCGIADTLEWSPKGVTTGAKASGRPKEESLSVTSSGEKPLVQFGSMSKREDGTSIYTGVQFANSVFPVVVTIGSATMQADKVAVHDIKLELTGNFLISKGDGSPDIEGQHAAVSLADPQLQVEKLP
jgi:hypothetical protein